MNTDNTHSQFTIHNSQFTISLAFFLSRATPLRRWQAMGIFERETAVYQRLSSQISGLSIVTSGGEEELAFQDRLPGIEILTNRRRLPPNLYSLLSPILHWRPLRRADLYKTNQLDGAWTAVIASKIHRKPAIVRFGYLWADNFAREFGDGRKARLIRRLERWTLRRASRIVVTTAAMRQTISRRYALDLARIHVIPNYVDTDLFCPDEEALDESRPFTIGFIGRLNPIKNLDELILAAAHLPDIRLIFIGDGPERARLAALAAERDVSLHLLGPIPNPELPARLRQMDLFVLPSQFEGHPKALIEAMACGLPVIGADVEGIRDVIAHGETGWLCPPTAVALRDAIHTLRGDATLRMRLGRAARTFTQREFSLTAVLEMELNLLRDVTHEA
ncbi:MAG: glycosyltransferase family 4 protein [Anaerolineae bacterium]